MKVRPAPRAVWRGARHCLAVLAVSWAAIASRAQPVPPNSSAPPATTNAVQLARIEVTETTLRTDDATALKLPLSLFETPRSISVLTADDFREKNLRRVQDSLAFVPGLFAFGQNEDTYRYYARGYNMGPDDTRFDGFSGYAIDMTQSPSLFGIERVAYLRGPAGLLYGATALPGGVINLESKRPRDEPFTRIDLNADTYAGSGLRFGSHVTRTMEVDTNGRLDSAGTLLYRIDAVLDERAFFNDGIHDRHRGILAAVKSKFGPNQRASLGAMFEYQTQPFAYGRAFALSPSTSLSTNDGRTGPVQTADLSPLRNYLSGGVRLLRQRIAGVEAETPFGDGWKTQLSYRYIAADAAQYQFVIQPGTLRQLNRNDPASWVIDRRQTSRETYRRNHGFDAQVVHETVASGGWQNRTQLGVNGRFYLTVRERAAATQPNQSPINIYTGVPVTPLVDNHPVLIDNFLTDDFYWNTYLQHQARWRERWVVTTALGYGEQELGRKYPRGLAVPANLAALTATRKGELTPNVSLLHHVTKQTALYASYGTSYQPPAGDAENRGGARGEFRPTRGINYEAGAKFDAGRWAGSVSVFETRLDRVLVQSDSTDLNGNGIRYFTQPPGSRRTRGIELSATARLGRGWSFETSGSVLDARYFGEGRVVGSRMERTPPLALNAEARHTGETGWGQRLTTTLGVLHQGARWSTQRTPAAPDPLLLPGYTVWRGGLVWRCNAACDVGLTVENALNRVYFITGATGSALEVGDPRRINLRVSWLR